MSDDDLEAPADEARPPRRRRRPWGDEDFRESPGQAARRAVSAPATALLICWIFGAMFALGFVVVAAYSVAIGDRATPAMREDRPILVFMGLVYPPAVAVGIYGAVRMGRLRSRGWALASAILLMIAFMGCLFGLAVGIWALTTLGRQDVGRAFRENAAPRRLRD